MKRVNVEDQPPKFNTPRAPPGPERIEVAYGKVPLRAGWVRMLCKGRESFEILHKIFIEII